jgi:hypothetical protein
MLDAPAQPAADSLHRLQAAFLSILPRIELHAQVYFRGLKCPHRKAEAVQETLALAWSAFVRLTDRGKDPLTFPATFARFAARAVKCGRRLCGQEKAKDVLSSLAQQRHGFGVETLPRSTATRHEERYGAVHGQRQQDLLEERLRDNTLTPVPEQVAFRLDFPSWLRTLTARERRIIGEMANNERTLDISKRFELSPARISQMRRELHNDWQRFCGDQVDAGSPQ